MLDVLKKPTVAWKRNCTMAIQLLDTGIRISELLNVQLEDVCLEGDYFKARGKGSKERLVPPGQSSRRALGEYLRKHRPEVTVPKIDPVFSTIAGYPLRPDYLYKIISRACQ